MIVTGDGIPIKSHVVQRRDVGRMEGLVFWLSIAATICSQHLFRHTGTVMGQLFCCKKLIYMTCLA